MNVPPQRNWIQNEKDVEACLKSTLLITNLKHKFKPLFFWASDMQRLMALAPAEAQMSPVTWIWESLASTNLITSKHSQTKASKAKTDAEILILPNAQIGYEVL